MSLIPYPSRGGPSWAGMSPELQRQARNGLAAELREQVSDSEAVIGASILAGLDFGPLAVSTADAAELLDVSPWRVMQLRHEGRLPVLLELYAVKADGEPHCIARVFWRAVCEAWCAHKASTPYRPGHGHRWEP